MTIREATKNILSSLNIYLNICDESIEDYLDIDDNIVAAIDTIAVQNTNSSFGIFVNNLKYIIYNYEIDFINDDTYSISGKKTIIDFHQSNLNGKSRLFAFADNDFSFVSLNLLTHRNVQTSNANDMLFSFKCLYDFLICDAAQNSYTVLMDLINNSSVYGLLTKKRTENINDIRDYSYVYMSFLNNSKHIIMASELEYNNMVLSSSLQYDENKKYILVFSVVLACFTGYDKSIGDFLYSSRAIVFFPFYLLGTMLKSEDIISIKNKYKGLYVVSILILLIWGFLCFYKIDKFYILRYLFTGRNAFYEPIVRYGALARLSCYILSLLILCSFIILIPNKKIKWISNMGKNSINVYFWHWKFYILLEKLFCISSLFYAGVMGKIEFLFVGLFISVVLSQRGIFEFPIKQIKRYCFS